MSTAVESARVSRRQVAAWAAWDWGSAAFNAVMVTFVFGTYLSSPAFGPDARGTAWLSTGMAIAGVVIALTAPIMGRRADRAGRRRLWLGLNTGIVILVTGLSFFVAPAEQFLLLGVVLLSLGTIFFEFAEIQINAILVQISTPSTVGRVSGIGWGAGYLGGIVLLLIVYVVFVSSPQNFGIPTEDSLNIRIVAVVAAVWFLIFALPVLVAVPTPPQLERIAQRESSESLWGSYRALGARLAQLWREERNTLRFLISSAVFRDGVGAVFVYGAILGTTVFGVDPGDIILFAIVANVVAAAGAFAGGWLDDRIGPRAVILGSLVAMVAVAIGLYFAEGVSAFWIGGLILCLFVGPVQSASRAFLGRLVTNETAGELYGLYATTGRAVGFITPALASIALAFVGDQRVIIPVIVVVLVAGGALLLGVRDPARATAPIEGQGTAAR
ncbi:MAG: MFS transporter [Micrococcus sp.]|nr:MFS transporter [Micrococcus sp.]